MDPDADEIVARVLGRFLEKEGSVHVGMARGFLVVDENVAFLERPLEEANFHVDTPEKGLSDAKKRMLGKRVLVTRNTKDFLADAPVYDYGIIGLEAVSVDAAPTYAQNTTAQLISEAYSKFKLHSKRTGFVLMLKPDGNHVFRRLG